MRNWLFAAVVVSLLGIGAHSDEPPRVDPWASFRFLVGDWVGEGEGKPGQGKGEFSLVEELQGKVLVRRNRAELPAGSGRPAGVHEDLLIVYPEAGDKTQKAIYFDSEGHVINYAVNAAEEGALIFVSDAKASGPRYRLSYRKQEAGKVTVKFEIAPPGKPDAFRTYLEGTVRNK
jgi:hypothetical protein